MCLYVHALRIVFPHKILHRQSEAPAHITGMFWGYCGGLLWLFRGYCGCLGAIVYVLGPLWMFWGHCGGLLWMFWGHCAPWSACRSWQRHDHLQAGEREACHGRPPEHPLLRQGSLPPTSWLHHLQGRGRHAAQRVGPGLVSVSLLSGFTAPRAANQSRYITYVGCILIVIINSFMFSKLEHIAHYQSKNTHTVSRIARRGEISEMIWKLWMCF